MKIVKWFPRSICNWVNYLPCVSSSWQQHKHSIFSRAYALSFMVAIACTVQVRMQKFIFIKFEFEVREPLSLEPSRRPRGKHK